VAEGRRVTKGVKMDAASLVSVIKSHRASALGVEDGDLSQERASAMDHYHGRPYGNEVEGRSQVVSRDLAEAVDWIMPAIMKVFTQSGRLAEFDPVGPEDEKLAEQESDYVNQVMMKDNPGFMVLHDAIKDTLLLKNGYAKHWWAEEDKTEEAEYSGMTLEGITKLITDLEKAGATVEVAGQESRMVDLGEMAGMPPQNPAQQIMQPMMVELFDIKLKITRKTGKVIWMATPSEEVRVSKKCRGSLQDSPFTEHVTKKTRSELIEMGIDADFVEGLPAYGETSTDSQTLARDSTDDESETTGGGNTDRSMDEIEFCEAYVKVDYEGTGVAQWRKVVTCADQIPPGDDWNEVIPAGPMTGFVAKRVPHRHIGESLDDELSDLQEIMTVLKRQLLDNIYRTNNAEMAVNEDANLRDFMTSTPGGVKRVRGNGPVGNAFQPIITTPIIDKILPVIDFFENSKETRTGVSRSTTTMDPDVLQNTTKGAYMEGLSRASQKVEMITRMLAETGVKESVLQVHGLLMRHQNQARTVQMRGKWVPVNPQEWKERTDLTVRVGLGTGSEEEKRTKLQLLSGLQMPLLQAIGQAPPPVYARMYALFEDVANTLGIDAPEKYAVTPMSPEHKQIQLMAQQQQKQGQGANQLAEAEQVKAQAALQMAAQKDQFERERTMLNARLDAERAEADRRLDVMLERMRLQSKEAIAAMAEETKLLLQGMRIDMGAPGLSAGVQGNPGMPMEMAGAPQGPPMDQQTMPPDGMGA
jgi:hypothetical protein